MVKELSRKEEIIMVSAKLFKEKSYLATTVRDIAKGMNFKSSSLYNHFSSKDKILGEICFSVANEYISNFESINKLDISSTEKIRMLIQKHIKMATVKNEFDTVTNDDWMHLGENDLKIFLALRKKYENKIIAMLEVGIQNNEFLPTNPRLTMLTIVGSPRWLHRWYRPERKESIDEIERSIINLLLGGLCISWSPLKS